MREAAACRTADCSSVTGANVPQTSATTREANSVANAWMCKSSRAQNSSPLDQPLCTLLRCASVNSDSWHTTAPFARKGAQDNVRVRPSTSSHFTTIAALSPSPNAVTDTRLGTSSAPATKKVAKESSSDSNLPQPHPPFSPIHRAPRPPLPPTPFPLLLSSLTSPPPTPNF